MEVRSTRSEEGLILQMRSTQRGGVSWIEAGFCICSILLLFQIFPNLWWGIVALLDVRIWTWKSYAVVSAIAIAILLVAKGKQDSRG
jgi:hypothetical protein